MPGRSPTDLRLDDIEAELKTVRRDLDSFRLETAKSISSFEPTERDISKVKENLANFQIETTANISNIRGWLTAVGVLFSIASGLIAVFGWKGIQNADKSEALTKLRPQMSALLTDSLHNRLSDTLNGLSVGTVTKAAELRAKELKDVRNTLEQLQPESADYGFMSRITDAITAYVIDKKPAVAQDIVQKVIAESGSQPQINAWALALDAAFKIRQTDYKYFSDQSIVDLENASKIDRSSALVQNSLGIELGNRCHSRIVGGDIPGALDDLLQSKNHLLVLQFLDGSVEGIYKSHNNISWLKLYALASFLETKADTGQLAASMGYENVDVLMQDTKHDLDFAKSLEPDNSAAQETLAGWYSQNAVLHPNEAAKDLESAVIEMKDSISRGHYDHFASLEDAIKNGLRDDPVINPLIKDPLRYKQVEDVLRTRWATLPH